MKNSTENIRSTEQLEATRNLKKLTKTVTFIRFIIFMLLILAVISVGNTGIKHYTIRNNNINANAGATLIEQAGESWELIQSAIISKITGTAPFDNNDEIGNDSSGTNNIVRSFDQIAWTIENTINLKDGKVNDGEEIVLQIKGELPTSVLNPDGTPNYVSWDLESMAWAEDTEILDNGRTFTANYTIKEVAGQNSIKQTVVPIIKVLGAPNGLEINPTFTLNILGNEENEKETAVYANNITALTTVTAAPRLNIQLKKRGSFNRKGYYDYGTGQESENKTATTVFGRMQGYGIAIQLYNKDFVDSEGETRQGADKGLKGIELPKGEITFDVTFDEYIGTTRVTEQENYTPKMWEYIESKAGDANMVGKDAGRKMGLGGNLSITSPYSIVPFNKGTGGNYCYDGGNWTITQDATTPTIYHITINEYKFSPEYTFPVRNIDQYEPTVTYKENIGNFSSGYMQVIMQTPEQVGTTTSIYMMAEATNIAFKTLSNQTGNQDENDEDNLSNESVTLEPEGTFSKNQYFISKDTTGTLGLTSQFNIASSPTGGDAYIAKYDELIIVSRISSGPSNDEVIGRMNVLQKFDDKAFEPLEGSNSSSGIQRVTQNALSTEGTLKVLYAAKPDKAGWIDSQEMEDTREEDLVYFSSIDELKQSGYKCVGVLYENSNIEAYPGSLYHYGMRVKIKDTAEIGKTYQAINDLRIFVQNNDFTWENPQNTSSNYPTISYHIYNGPDRVRYTKTEYDENGEIVTGTHGGGYLSGNTVLIIGATQQIGIKAIDEQSNTKTNYDISRNENVATIQLAPGLVGENNIQIDNVALKITTTLPKELTYIQGTAKQGTNVIDVAVTENGDGTSTLVFNLYGCKVNETIEPITFETHIDEETPNGTSLPLTAVIQEIISDGEDSRIGNTREEARTANTSIQIVNLASYSLYKTTDTPLIEVNGKGKFTVTAANRTDDDLTTFQLLDILPYNGDGRGTNYSGTYTVEKIELKATNAGTGETVTNDLKLYTTENESSRTGVQASDSNLATGWTEVTSGTSINKELTAFAVKGTLPARTKLDIEIIIKTEGNKSSDVYQNSTTARTNISTEKLESIIVKIEVVKRELSGIVWLDANNNGIIDEGERNLAGITVRILNSDGTYAKDVYGNIIQAITTDENGYYKFEDMEKGNYKVQAEIDGTIYKMTDKEVGSNKEINSKFNTTITNNLTETDTYTKFNTTESPLIREQNVNAGLIQIEKYPYTVNYYDKDTGEKIKTSKTGDSQLSGTEILVESEKVEIEDYVFSNSEVLTGEEDKLTIVEDNEKNVINLYYYKVKKDEPIIEPTPEPTPTPEPEKQNGKVTIKYVDIDTKNEISERETKEGVVGDKYTTKEKTIDKYTYVESSGNTEGNYKESEQEVTYYYKKIDKTQTTDLLPFTGSKTTAIALAVFAIVAIIGIVNVIKYKDVK